MALGYLLENCCVYHVISTAVFFGKKTSEKLQDGFLVIILEACSVQILKGEEMAISSWVGIAICRQLLAL